MLKSIVLSFGYNFVLVHHSNFVIYQLYVLVVTYCEHKITGTLSCIKCLRICTQSFHSLIVIRYHF